MNQKPLEIEKSMTLMQNEIDVLKSKVELYEPREISSDEESESEISIEIPATKISPEYFPLSEKDLGDHEDELETYNIKCELCDFTTKKQSGLAIHRGIKHKSEAEDNLKVIDIKTYDDYSLQKSGKCFKLLKIHSNKQLGFVHDCFCWSFYSPCPDLPEEPPDHELPNMIRTKIGCFMFRNPL